MSLWCVKVVITMPDYLCKNRHNDTYYFRFIVPSDLEPFFEKKVYRRTLSTKDKKTARIAARAARVAFDRLLSEVSSMSNGIPTHFTDDELIDYINEGIAYVRKHDKEMADSLVPDEAIEVNDALRKKKEEFLTNLHKKIESSEFEIEVKPDLNALKVNQVRPKKSQSKKNPSYKLSQLVQDRLEELEKANPNAPAGAPYKELESGGKHFVRVIGDKEVSDLTTQDFQKLYDELHSTKFTTCHKWIRALKILFDVKESIRVNYLNGVNPVKEVTQFSKPLKKVKDTELREQFTDDEIRRILSDENLAKHQNDKKPYLKWLPILAAYTGARSGELLHLTRDSVKKSEGGIWYLDIAPEEDQETGLTVRSVKAANSIRKVPLAAKIIELGFLDYVQNCNIQSKYGYLFHPDKQSHANELRDFSNNASTHLSKVIKTAGAHVSHRKTFHSFRHTVITRLAHAGCSLVDIQHLVGHLDQDDERGLSPTTAKTYIKDPSNLLEKLKGLVDQINY